MLFNVGIFMKYGESTFDIFYLLFAIISGFMLLNKARNKTEKNMGWAVLILGCGDAFHLVPRVLNYFIDADFTIALGIGKLVTSITMTIFYVFMYYIYLGYWHEESNGKLAGSVWMFAIVRVLLCALPQNRWVYNDSGMLWGIIRNIPFVLLGLIIIWLYIQKRKEPSSLKNVWLLVLLSFLFYIPVAVGAGIYPMLGMLMLPKTICYILLIVLFRRAVLKDEER